MKNLFLVIVLFITPLINGISQVVVNEVLASNVNSVFDKGQFNFSGYIELYNKNDFSVDITNYYITNDISRQTRYKFPSGIIIQPKQFLKVICDEANYWLHTNFKLDADGGIIILSNSNLQVVDSVSFRRQYPDISIGRKPDGAAGWTYLAYPTPGAKNNVQSGSQLCAQPTISPNPGYYTDNVTVRIYSNMGNATIYYTTDGSEPSNKSKLYTGPFVIAANTVVKAKNYHNEYLPGTSSCNTYLLKEHVSKLPIVSISTNPDYLFNDSIGIYVEGKNGIAGNCVDKANWNRDWERPGFFEYFEPDGRRRIVQGTDLKISGGCSRSNPQKSFGILPSSRYGKGSIDYPFFASKPDQTNFGSLMVRNSGNDWYTAKFRDAFMQNLAIHNMDLDYQAFQPVAFYVNGAYWGIMNLREKIDKNYFRANHNLPSDSVDMVEKNGEIICGDNKGYLSFVDSLTKVDMSKPEGFDFLNRNIDIDEYLNYLVLEIYCGNHDWPGNNNKFWRSKAAGSKWRWMATDLDFGFGLYNSSAFDSTLNFVTATNGPKWPNPPWSTLLPRKIFENPTTRDLFIQKMQTAIHTIFRQERVNFLVDSIKNMMAPEMPYHWKRWWGSESQWNNEVNKLKLFNLERGPFMENHLRDFFKLDQSNVSVSIKSAGNNQASFYLNNIIVNDSLPVKLVAGLTAEIKVETNPGYEFDFWSYRENKTDDIKVIEKGTLWKYYDKVEVAYPLNWSEPGFDDSLWQEGMAELGYGDGGEKSVIEYGGNASNKYITTCFRKTFNLSDTTSVYSVTGGLHFDDGAVVYLNGEEIYRINLPSGQIFANTMALVANDGNGFFQPFEVPKKKLKIGQNLVAVEIHQSSPSSSDISFDLMLNIEKRKPISEGAFLQANLSKQIGGELELIANFKENIPVTGILINEVSAKNELVKDDHNDFDDWIELYNNGFFNIDLSKIFIEFDGYKKIAYRLAKSEPCILKPGEHKLMWADGEIDEGANHLPFELFGEGEIIRLYQPVGANKMILDSFTVGAKYPKATIGRYPDGANSWVYMNKITPGETNEYQPMGINKMSDGGAIEIYPNPTKGIVNLEFWGDKNLEVDIDILSGEGRIMKSKSKINAPYTLDLSSFADGMYIIKLKIGERVYYKKVMVLN